MTASDEIVRQRLAARKRINIASAEDTELFNSFLNEWLNTISPSRLLQLDVSEETPDYDQSIKVILARVKSFSKFRVPRDGE